MNKEKYEIVKEYVISNQQKFYRLAFSYVKNEEAALDVVQNSICKLLECYEEIHNMKYLSTYFYRVIVNESLGFIRKNSKEIVCGEENIREEAYVQEYGVEGDDTVLQALDTLTDEVRTVVVLRFYNECSLKEIAKITETNLSTVKSRLYAGLNRLKQALREVENEER
ncbi:RNA polymerase sigma factor [Anaerosporobacter sp.]|uniref:RNA polymerase sigma factor n=1 Tax=Anaerosporobacter sp. TaxID=1872529 RepID=UPI00286F5FD1|nr:sigma-70 family RNA polymerase sigma factor [Anaerosporobacter sp.]